MNDYKPAYRKIIDELLHDISTGIYSSGDMIPSQAKLAEMYHVSRITVRDAINELTHRDILYTKQGKGTYVNTPSKFSYPVIRSQSFSSSIIHSGQEITTKVLSLERVKTDNRLQIKFGIELDKPLVCLKRLRIVENIPLVITTSYLDAECFPQIDFFTEDFSMHSLYMTLAQKAGLVIKYADEEIKAVCCPSKLASIFGIGADAPVLYIMRKTFDESERCFEWGEQYERTDYAGIHVRSSNKPE